MIKVKKCCLFFTLLFAVVLTFSLCGCSTDVVKEGARDLNCYYLDMSLDESTMTLTAVQTVEYTHCTSESISEVKFNLFANVYASDSVYPPVSSEEKLAAYPNGYSYGNITVDNVSIEEQSLPFVIEEGVILCVPVQKGLHQGESVTIKLNYRIKLANILHRLGYGENTVNLGNFFPILCHIENGQFRTDGYYSVGDPFVSACANFDISLCVPDDYVVASSTQLTRTEEQGVTIFHGEAQAVRDFALVLSKKFQSVSTTERGVAVTYYFYNDQQMNQTLRLCADAVNFFSKLMVDYPYETLAISQSDFCYGGMEYPRLVMVSGDIEREEYMLALVHEIAHQWVYGLVGNDQINDAFMDEGLAEYLTYRFFEQYSDYGINADNMIKQAYSSFITYLDIMNSHASHADTSLRPLSEYSSWRSYAYTTYVKGCIMFYELEKMMGRSNFDRGLSHYIEDNLFQIASRQNLFDCFSRAYGTAVDDWFCSVLDGKDLFLSSSEN